MSCRDPYIVGLHPYTCVHSLISKAGDVGDIIKQTKQSTQAREAKICLNSQHSISFSTFLPAWLTSNTGSRLEEKC